MNISTILKKTRHGGYHSFLKSALDNGISVKPIDCEKSLVRLDHEGTAVFCQGHIPLSTRLGQFTKNKCVTKTILDEVSIRVPKGFTALDYNDSLRLIKKNKINYPVIVKPVDGSRAAGVSWNIQSDRELESAIYNLRGAQKKHPKFLKSRKILIEEMFIGDEYRILVLNDRVLSVVKKIPASITGDGKSTIAQLITKFNKTRLRGFKLVIDDVVRKTLKDNKLNLSSVLSNNYTLKLRNNLNMSDGGRCIEWTKKMHPYFKEVCVKAVEILGGSIGGVDLIAPDVSKASNNYVILEVNPNPYYNMHEKPLVEGKGIDVSKIILKSIFPRLK